MYVPPRKYKIFGNQQKTLYNVISKVADVENSKWLLSWSKRHISTTRHTWTKLRLQSLLLEPLPSPSESLIASWHNLSWDLIWSLECQQHVWLILSYTTKYDRKFSEYSLDICVFFKVYSFTPPDPEDVQFMQSLSMSSILVRHPTQDTHSWLEQWAGLFILYPAPSRGSSLSGGTPGYGAAPEY